MMIVIWGFSGLFVYIQFFFFFYKDYYWWLWLYYNLKSREEDGVEFANGVDIYD